MSVDDCSRDDGLAEECLSPEGTATLLEGFEGTVHELARCGVFTVEGHSMAPLLLDGRGVASSA